MVNKIEESSFHLFFMAEGDKIVRQQPKKGIWVVNLKCLRYFYHSF